ncbi:holo-ACP synthase [bacterium]|nr:holo-ACP synthase [bacterium]
MKIGCDIEENSRFQGKTLDNDENFLTRIFSARELKYCFSKKNYHQNLCARFCAKEAYIKASGDKNIPLNKIEVLNKEDGAPYLVVNNEEINGTISLSHAKNNSMAVVLLNNVKNQDM